jgi:hypothetical protein
MLPRLTGRSSITARVSLYYIAHVLLGVFVNILKYDRRFHRAQGASPKQGAQPGPGAGAGG